MRIEWATSCLGVQETAAGIHLFGIQKKWLVPPDGLPFTARAIVAVMFSIPYEDMGSEREYVLWERVLTPDFDLTTEWTAIRQWGCYAPDATHPPGMPGTETYKLDLAFPADKPGVYTIQLQIDDQEPIFSLPLLVSERVPT